ncbi:UDP-glucose/GDP-mannose dehydrogenase family protein [Nocardioides sp. KR10-350]|uniref:UDP-glucose dehydrogenase family protein n=1 Tax=Nocardioides cheoyonin TaxID=3156615 RepID=UPI0032B5299D
MRMTVIGSGYLGATHAACMAELGHEVVGVDTDPAKVEALSAGRAPFFEPDLEPLLRKHTETGRLRFTTSLAEAARGAAVHFVCVGTPQQPGRPAADTSAVEAVVEELAPLLAPGAVVVGKSTVPVGLAAALRRTVLAGGAEGADLAWNPEFLREGYAVEDTLRPDRIVVGADRPETVEVVRAVYADAVSRGTPFLTVGLETAELVKVAANSFLATKISFINAMAEFCEATGADVVDLAHAVGYDDRIGHRFLKAGLGFGGGCLPKDIRAFQARASELGLGRSVGFLGEVDEINTRRREKTVDLAHEILGGRVSGRRVAVLGAAFKPDSDDVRDSPALDVADQLYLRGAEVTVYDPEARETARRHSPRLSYADSLAAAVEAADLVLLLTEWAEFVAMDPAAVGDRVAHRAILDARNVLDPRAWQEAGWTYRGLGRG